METVEERIRKAIETYDHLLWQAIINVGGMAGSAHFSQENNAVRVVYVTSDPDRNIYFDPRDHFSEIKEEAERLIVSNLAVRKIGKKLRQLEEALELCTHESYQLFLLTRQSNNLECVRFMLENGGWINCDFVKVGEGTSDYFCCPCVGKHLGNTGELKDFGIDLVKPKRVGENTYEFRFSVKAK